MTDAEHRLRTADMPERTRLFGVTVFRNARGVPMVSLGIHVDLHTPTLDLHLPLATVQIGRNNWEQRRFVYHPPMPWNGHTDNCSCDRNADARRRHCALKAQHIAASRGIDV